jgi:predicted secreted protein
VEHQRRHEASDADLATYEEEAAATVVEAKDDESLDWSDDELDAEEQAAQQKTLLESLKKVEDDAQACGEDNEERWRRTVDLSIEADRLFSAEHRERLREDWERQRAAYEGEAIQRTIEGAVRYKCSNVASL